MSVSTDRLAGLSAAEKRALLADILRKKSAGAAPQTYPVSPAQRALWNWRQFAPESPAYNLVGTYSIAGPADEPLLRACLERMQQRHAALRTIYCLESGELRQRPMSSMPIDFRTIEVDDLPAAKAALWNELSDRPFDLEHGPLWRATLLREGDRRHALHFAVHHIAADLFSIALLARELFTEYTARIHGDDLETPSPAGTYFDYVAESAELTAREGDAARDYWVKQLADPPAAVELPVDRPRGNSSFAGAVFQSALDRPLTAKLRRLAEAEGVTPYTLFAAGLHVLLRRYSGQDDIAFAAPVLGRDDRRWFFAGGYFSTTAAVRLCSRPDQTFRELAAVAQRTIADARRYAFYPFASVVDQAAVGGGAGRHPWPRLMLAWEKLQSLPDLQMRQNADGRTIAFLPRWNQTIEDLNVEQRGAPYELTIQAYEGAEQIHLRWQYDVELFDESTIARIAENFGRVLEAIATAPDSQIDELSVSSASDDALQEAWNRTERNYPIDDCLYAMIERQVARTPDAPAVSFDDVTLNYRELNDRADRLAARLRAVGVGPDTIVGVLMVRSTEMVVSLVAVLKAGGTYLPLNPDDPRERSAFQLADAEAKAVLTQPQFAAELPEGVPAIVVEPAAANVADDPPPASAGAAPAGPRNLAYVIYTSGSTGRPKGVLTEHRAIVNRLLWMQDEYRLTPADRVLQKTPFTFDVSVWEFFWPLIVGAEIVVAKPQGHREPEYLAELIRRRQVTVLHFVPTMLGAFLAHDVGPRSASLRMVFASGEALSSDLVARFHETCDAELHNLYGPTEASVDVTYWPCRRDDRRAMIPIGRPIANTRIEILDGKLRRLPIGVAGELCIGGVGLARGYLKRPELTAERFVADPRRPGERLYRTGDRARFLPDGAIEYLGRFDGQVKLGGNRIELGEIEAALEAQPEVSRAVAVVREDEPGRKRLTAYVVPRSGLASPLDVAHLVRTLRERLPPYMIPSAIVPLADLPQTTSGKVDRNALPAPPRERADSSVQYRAPRNEDERLLADIFAEVLEVERIGIDDNFFQLGGASNQALEIMTKAAAAGFTLSPELVFQNPTIAALSEAGVAPRPAVGNTYVESLGVFLPERTVSTEEVMRGCRVPVYFPLEQLTGIHSRRMAGDKEFAIDLAFRAAEECLRRSRRDPAGIDLVVCCNISRCDAAATFIIEPSTALRLAAKLGLPDALAFDVNNACAGMFTGIAAADGLIRAGIVRRALVVSGEYITHLTETAQRKIEHDFDNRLPCLTVGDAGAAVLLESASDKRHGFHSLDICTLAQYADYCTAKFAPGGPIMVTDVLGVSNVVTQEGVEHWARIARAKSWSLENIRHVIPHQVSDTTVVNGFNEARKRFGVEPPEGIIISNVGERANTASTSHWVAVWDHSRAGRIRPGDDTVFGVSGSGINIGTALYTFDDLPERLRSDPPTKHAPRGEAKPRRVRRKLDPRLPRTSIAGHGAVFAAPGDTALKSAARAVERCLAEAGVAKHEINLLLYTGVYRDDFLCEPSMASLVAQELRLHNAAGVGEHPPFFSYDLLNGSVGFLQAVYLAAQKIQAGGATKAVVAAAEIDDEAQSPAGTRAAGSALLLSRGDDVRRGFGDFVFRNAPQYMSDRTAAMRYDEHQARLTHHVAAEYHVHAAESLAAAVAELLELERLRWDDIAWALPPQISPEFHRLLVEHMPQLAEKAVVVEDAGGDLFTSSIPFAWQTLQQRRPPKPGEIGLLLSIGAGIQAACATYYA